MSSVKRYIVLALMLVTTLSVKAQCPALLSTLLAGGTFNDGGVGPCVYAAGGAITTTGNINFTGSLTLTGVTSLTIANDVVWNGGVFNIQGTGALNVGNGTTGSLTINSGSINTNDGGSGTVTVATNANLNVASSSGSITAVTFISNASSTTTNDGTITASGAITLGGIVTTTRTLASTSTSLDITITGTVSNSGEISALHDVIVSATGNLTVADPSGSISADNFHINAGGVTIVESGGFITANDNTISTADEDDNIIEGELTSFGTLSFNGDMVVQGGDARVTINGGTVTVTRPSDGDLEVTGGATFTMNAGTITLPDDLTTAGSTADFVINGGTLDIYDDLSFSGGSFQNNGTILADDIKMTGGTFHNTGSITISERDGLTSADLEVSGGTFENDGNIDVADDLLLNLLPGGSFFNDETMTIGDDIAVSAAGTLKSNEAGAVITLADQYTDPNCPYANGIYHYCSCLGNPDDNDNASQICASALPIELIEFSGSQKGNAIHFNWTTATETNNDFFTIQKLTSIDNFEEVARVQGSGTTVMQQSYSAIDPNPTIGKNYYRLKQTDYDGKTSSSKLIKVVFESNSFVVQLFPNPATHHVTLAVQGMASNEPVQINVRNSVGQTTLSTDVQANESGAVTVDLSLENFSPGVYSVSVNGKTQKLIVR
ncbi:MAG TPA: T9SS type A sorting domain-containing protein [Chryseosolibacter sp.]